MNRELKIRLDEAFKGEEEGDFGQAADCFLEAAALVHGLDGIPVEVLEDDNLLCRWVVGCFAPSDYGFASYYHVKRKQDPLVAGFKLVSILPDRDGEIDFWKRYFEDLALGDPVQKHKLRGQGLKLHRAIYEADLDEGSRILEHWGLSSAIRTSQLRGYL
jgi:hypothetical protein